MRIEAEANLSALIESTEDLIWSVDLDYRLVTFNQALQRNIQKDFGVQLQAGMRFHEVLNPERVALWPAYYARVLAEGPFRMEYNRNDGGIMELAFNPIVVEGITTGISVFGKEITERKKAEESRRFLAEVVESCEEAIITNAPSGEILTWNHAAEAIYGYSAEEAIGKPVSMIIAPGLRALAERQLKELLAGAPLLQTQGVALRKDGGRVHISVTTWPIRNLAQEVTAVATIVRDISIRYEAEKYRALLASVVESSGDLIHAVNLDGTIASWNLGAERMTGYTSDEVLGKKTEFLVPPRDDGRVRKNIRTIREGCTIGPFDTIIRRKDGTEIDVSLTLTPIRNSNGEVTGAAAIARDISQRKQIERKLEEAEKKYRTIFEGALEGIFQTTLDGQALVANPAVARMLGYDSPQDFLSSVKNTAFDVWVFPEERARYISLLKEAGVVRNFECQFRRKDGTILWAAFNARKTYAADGKTLVNESFIKDITESKLSEMQLRVSLDSLKESQEIGGLGSYVLDIGTGVWTSSDVMDEIFGIGKEYERTIAGWTALIHPDDRAMMAAYLAEEVVGKGLNFDKEYRIVRQTDQAVRWVHGLGRLEFDGKGQPVKMRGVIKDITESKLSEMQVHDSEERYRATFEQAAVGIVLTSFDGMIVRCNARFAAIVGYPLEEIPGLSVRLITAPEDRAASAEVIQRVASGAGAEVLEKRYIRKDGSLFWAKTTVSMQRDGQGRPLHIIAFIEDINERKKAEMQLRDSEERYRATFEQAPIGIVHASLEGRYLRCNARFAEIIGYPQEEVPGLSFQQITVPEDLESSLGLHHQLREGAEEIPSMEKRYVRKDGNLVWVRVTLSPQRDGEGRLLYFIAIVEEIQARKEAEERLKVIQEALRRSEERYRTIFQMTLNAITIIRIDDETCIDLNEAYIAITGYQREDVIGKTGLEIGIWANPEDRRKMFEAVRQSSLCLNLEAQFKRKNGTFFWGILSASKIELDGVPCILTVTRDITDAKAAEERLAAFQESLRASELRYRTIFEASADAVIITGLREGKIIDANQSFLDSSGYERHEVLGITGQELGIWVNESDRQRFFDGLAHDGTCRDFEALSRRRNGEIFWMRISASIIEIEGIPCRLIAARDITEAKRAEERLVAAAKALQSSEERYRTAFQANLDAMIINRADDGRFIDCNQAFLDTSGFTRDEVLGRTTLELGVWVDTRDRTAVREMLHRDSSYRGLEVQFKKKNGEVIWGEMSATLMEVDGVPCILSIIRDLSAAKAAESTIRSLAFYDPLTGLPNRRHLLERLRQPRLNGARRGHSQALLLVDLDHFKTLNDTIGHRTGDLLLQEVARRIAACAREADTVFRLGGDEFVVLLEGLSKVVEEAAAQAEAMGEKILAAISLPCLLEERECLSTASIGIAFLGDRRDSTDEILQQAEIALYQAKAAGRNTLRFFSPALQAAVNARAAMEEDLRQGIKANQFLLYYQPQIERGRLTGAEALIRWKHPKRGLVQPNDFIPLAEESKLILPLGDWVLEAACTQIALWAGRKETAHLSIAVNISALQFRQPTFIENVLEILSRTGANPGNLRLELTESMLVENFEDIVAKMTRLKEHGLRFSLDDFGTGYSSMTYLKRLPLDLLKIDRSFVRDMLVDATSGAIAQTILSLGRAMGLSVVAEGVETEEQRGYLAALGCHSFQGYLFSRPLPLDKFEEFLHNFAKGGGPS